MKGIALTASSASEGKAMHRRNTLAFLGDYVGFGMGMTFASTTTVLPDLVSRLTDSQVAVGVLSTISSGAWMLPQLFYANWLSSKPRKKVYVIWGGLVGRPLYLIYAIALALGLYRQPILALLLLYLVQGVLFGSDALATVAWFDVMGKVFTESARGRLIGRAQLVSGVLSLGAGALIGFLLGADGPGYPYNHAVILGIAGLWLLFSLYSWSFVSEPDEPVEERRSPWREYVPRLFRTLREDRAFSRLILVRMLLGLDGLALGFYVLFATRELGLPASTIGVFTAAQTAGRLIASVALGALAERKGSHRVVQAASAVGLTAPLVGLVLLVTGVRDSLVAGAALVWVFASMGVTMSAGMLGSMNYVMELAPAGQRPTYIGLLNTLTGLLIVMPTIGGWLLEVTSYTMLFVLTAGGLILAHALSWGLPSARALRAAAQAKPIAQ